MLRGGGRAYMIRWRFRFGNMWVCGRRDRQKEVLLFCFFTVRVEGGSFKGASPRTLVGDLHRTRHEGWAVKIPLDVAFQASGILDDERGSWSDARDPRAECGKWGELLSL